MHSTIINMASLWHWWALLTNELTKSHQRFPREWAFFCIYQWIQSQHSGHRTLKGCQLLYHRVLDKISSIGRNGILLAWSRGLHNDIAQLSILRDSAKMFSPSVDMHGWFICMGEGPLCHPLMTPFTLQYKNKLHLCLMVGNLLTKILVPIHTTKHLQILKPDMV